MQLSGIVTMSVGGEVQIEFCRLYFERLILITEKNVFFGQQIYCICFTRFEHPTEAFTLRFV